MTRKIRIAVALDQDGYWIARGHSDAADADLARAAADDLADAMETYFVDVELPESTAGNGHAPRP